MPTRESSDVIVIGAGVVGAACAHYAALAGLSVTVVDRGYVAGGTTGAGEGNLLVSDKEPGPELQLALLSTAMWTELADRLPPAVEYEAKGGLVVASGETGLDALREFAARQEKAGVVAHEVPGDRLHDLEPHLAPGLTGGFHYPQDAQVMPAHAAARLLHAAGDRVRLAPGGGVNGRRTRAGGAGRGGGSPRGPGPAGGSLSPSTPAPWGSPPGHNPPHEAATAAGRD
ncbi:NAD(P)/FAD-dependent oxidoreductase, partial [Streptomyces zaomyceticus]|uniref:NAD(P)/FAD-dependent oxidoreductase n=1 Tax=Streptomyces zaomyceticus TaxID=68286 RepID=UPI00368771A9